MAVAQPVAKRPQQAPASPVPKPRSEAVWVFESSRGASDPRAAAEIALKCHGAASHQGTGPTGNSYAIVTRGEDNGLLPFKELRENVQAFLQHAGAHAEQTFRIVNSAYSKSDEEHLKFAELFRNAPANCLLPGRWLELLERLRDTRIIVLDANVKAVDTAERKHALDLYFAANEGLWNAPCIELVSFGMAHTLVHNDLYAKGRGYKHRIINVDTAYYGKLADLARQVLSIAYATKLVCFADPMSTSTGFHLRPLQLATAAGLQIDEVLTS